MNFDLTMEQRLLVDSVRAFVEKELYPHEDTVERTGEVPPALDRAIRAKATAQGLYAANMPEDLGGGGLDALTTALMERELGRAAFALQYIVHRHYSLSLERERDDCLIRIMQAIAAARAARRGE